MPKGIMTVYSRPASAAEAADYHEWYDATHIPELLAVDGFSSAERYEAVDGSGFLAIYELDVDPDIAKGNLSTEQASGRMTRPAGMQLDPPPTVTYYRAR